MAEGMSDLDRARAAAPSTPGRFDLHGKVAVVVGGTKGLGQGMALALAASGADVCVVGRDAQGLADTAAAICELGRKGTAYSADVTDEQQVIGMLSYLLETYGKVDILVNSQGVNHLQASEEYDTAKWEWVMDVNVKSVFLCCKHVGGQMLKQGKGKIINIASVRGFQGRAKDPAYAPSKGAVIQLTHSLAIEWGPKGINVNGIAPTFTRTAMAAHAFEDPVTRAWVLGRIPMGRAGEVEDLFGPVVFLASEASNLVNGQVLPVDGGWLAA
jgi:NAD(P)-dependent dehydrogenase (short-subunit alcohol dehydrogenase family)